MDLSVIIPVYNTPRDCLRRCFDSIAFSEQISVEAIIVDDGSEEKIGDFCRQYADTHAHFRYIRQENGGVSSARNTGIAHAEGKYLLFADGDDELIPQNIAPQDLSANYDIVFYYFNVREAAGQRDKNAFSKHKEGEVSRKEALTAACNNRLNAVFAKLFRRSLLVGNHLRFDESMVLAEDALFVLNAIWAADALVYANRCVYRYHYLRETGNRRILRFPERVFANSFALYQARQELLETYGGELGFSDAEIVQMQTNTGIQLIKDWFAVLAFLSLKGCAPEEMWRAACEQMKKLRKACRRDFSLLTRLKYRILRYEQKRLAAFYIFLREGYFESKVQRATAEGKEAAEKWCL